MPAPGSGLYATRPPNGRVSFLPSNTIVIVPRRALPFIAAGTWKTHTAWPPTNRADFARSVLPPTLAVHVTWPPEIVALVSLRVADMRTM